MTYDENKRAEDLTFDEILELLAERSDGERDHTEAEYGPDHRRVHVLRRDTMTFEGSRYRVTIMGPLN